MSLSLGDLKAHEERIRRVLAEELKSCSLFLISLDINDADAVKRVDQLCAEIVSRLVAEIHTIPVAKLGLPAVFPESIVVNRLLIRNTSPDSARREIENILASQTGEKTEKGRRVRLSRYGLFIPRTGSITCHSFAHGHGHYYRFRLAIFKIDSTPPPLRDFLVTLPERCPPDHDFLNGPRASSFDMKLAIRIESYIEHPIIRLAQGALRVRKLKSAHEDVEKYLLESDPETVACEVPVWFEPNELRQLALAKSDEDMLTGHIDVLRYEQDGKIGIWDYKPSAAEESKAHIQVFLYALMLSRRTGLSLEHFRCGYFDSANAFVIIPAEVHWSHPA